MKLLKRKIVVIFASLYRRFLVRRATLRLNQILFELTLNGLGVLNHQDDNFA
jgi:hypothetical protein